MTKEEIAKKYVPCRCDEAYTSRGLIAPDCPYHSTDPETAMDEYAKQQAIAFAIDYAKRALTWKHMEHIKSENVEHDRMEERYNQFIEQQNK